MFRENNNVDNDMQGINSVLSNRLYLERIIIHV